MFKIKNIVFVISFIICGSVLNGAQRTHLKRHDTHTRNRIVAGVIFGVSVVVVGAIARSLPTQHDLTQRAAAKKATSETPA